jgi:dihydrofolate synthase/folylpolyglutamate synthase
MPLAEVISRATATLAKLQLPGRFEVCWPDGDAARPVILDGAHTPCAATALAATLRDVLGQHLPVLLVGLSADKDAEAIAAILTPRAAQVICSQQPSGGLAPDRLAAACEAMVPGRVTVVPDLAAAVIQARKAATGRQTAVVATGGMHFAAAVAKEL